MSNLDPSRNAPARPPGTTPPAGGSGQGGSGSAGTDPGQQGREVAGHARSEVEEHAQTVADKTGEVVETAQKEVRDVVDEARDVVRREADRQSEVAAGALGHLRDDLRAMTDGGEPRDATAQYVRQAADALDNVVGRLESDGIEGALSGVRSFARRSPGGFLLASAGAGFAVGRILRNADDPRQVEQSGGQSRDGSDAGGQGADQRRSEIDLTAGSAAGSQAGAGLTGREAPR